MQIQKSELAGKLSKVKSIVPKKLAVEAMQGVLVKDRKLIANNFEVTAKLDLDCEGDDTFIIPAKAFDLINSLPDGEVEIQGTDSQVIIKAKKIRNKYATVNPELFSLQTEKEEGDTNKFSIDSGEFLRSMKRVSYAISPSSANNQMNCLCLRAKDGKLNYITLDGHMISWDKADFEGDFELLIPKNTVDRLQNIGLSGDLTITSTNTSAMFQTEGCEITSRIVMGKFFDVEKIVKMETPIQTVIGRREMVEALTRARMCSTAERIPVTLLFKGDEVTVRVASSVADYSEAVELQKEMPEEFKIGFDSRLLIESLKSFDDDEVEFNMASPKMPVLLRGETEYLAVVLPVMVRE